MRVPSQKAGLATVLAPVRALAEFGRPLPNNIPRALWAKAAKGADPCQVYEALTPILVGRHVPRALECLLAEGVLDVLLPSLAATSRMSTSVGRYKNVWEHTKEVVWQSVPLPRLRWAALLHDVGKVATIGVREDGRVHFLGHEQKSYEIFGQDVVPKVHFDPHERDIIAYLILHHQRPSQYQSDWSDAAVRRFAREHAGMVDELLLLSRADITSKIPGKRRSRLFAISELARRIRSLAATDAKGPRLPKGFGRALMAELSGAPGPKIGEIMARLHEKIDAKELPIQAVPEVYLSYARAQGWI